MLSNKSFLKKRFHVTNRIFSKILVSLGNFFNKELKKIKIKQFEYFKYLNILKKIENYIIGVEAAKGLW